MEKYYYIQAVIPLTVEDEVDGKAHSDFGCSGIEEFSLDEENVDRILGDRSYSGADLPVSVINEVDSTVKAEGITKKYHFQDVEKAKKYLEFLESENFPAELKEEEVKDWNEEWKKSYSPILVGDELEIVPSWNKGEYDSPAKNSLYIYPGMGFGTGSHETTFLCLKLLLEVFQTKNDFNHVLDFGCGSGILSMGHHIFYPECNQYFYDIEQEALDNCVQNFELNEFNQESFHLLLPPQREKIERKFDLVFANILQNVLLLEKEYLANSLNPGASLLLSGLLKGQEDEVIKAYQEMNPKLSHIKTLNKGDWVAVHMRLD